MLANYFKAVLLKRQGVAIGVWGEAGIGKSYQVTQLLRELLCRQASFHATIPLTALAKTLPHPERLALWATRGLERLEQGEALEPSTLLDALGAVLAGLAPFVLHLEDIHEASQERLEFIQALARMVQRIKGVGLIVTSRNEPSEPFTPVRLEPLSPESSSLLLEQELTATLPGEAPLWIYSKAAGNPLYTLEYLRYLTRQGFLWSDGKTWHWREPEGQFMPATIEALIEQLLNQARTEPLQRYVLETKTLLPLNASDELWCKVARVNAQELERAVAALLQQGVFQEKGFAHPLFREVTLKTMGVARKRDLSRRAINVLSDNPEQAALFVEAARLEPQQSLEILKRAAEQTKERNKVEAARFLAKAVNYATGEEKSKLALEAASVLRHQDIPRAIAFVEQLLSEEPNNIEALYLGTLLYALDAQEAKAKELFSHLPSSEHESQRGVEMLLEIYRALDKYDDFLTLWEQNKTRLPTLESKYLYFVVAILSQRAKPWEAITLASASLERSNLPIDQRTRLMNSLGLAYMDYGQHEQALEVFNQLIDLYASHLDPRRLTGILHNRAMSKTWLGRYIDAKSDITQSYQLANESGSSYGIARALNMLSNVAIELGEYEQAETYLTNSLDLLRKRHLTPHVVDAEVNMCSLYLSWQLPHSGILALKHAYAALACAKEVEDAYSMIDGLFMATLAEASYGSATKALELAGELAPLAQRNATPIDIYYAAWAKAKAFKALNRFDESKDCLQKAHETAHQAKHELMANKIGLELDHLNNDSDSARERLKWFEERGLMNGANIARRYFPELTETKPSPETVETNLRLEVLGSMQFFANGKQESVRGRKRKELFACLLEARMAGRGQLSQLDLADKLHPDNPDENLETIKQLVYQMRVAFGQTVIITSGTGYALGTIRSDAETFLENGDTTLWRGEYLEGVDSSDDMVSGALYHALKGRVKDLLGTDPTEAARVGRILVNAEPYELESWRLTLKAVQQSSTVQSVEKLYRECSKRMAEVGEVLPQSWEVFLA
jgi:tetratricopeptide (TPR) repeat protein